jgi:hypothetical protein
MYVYTFNQKRMLILGILPAKTVNIQCKRAPKAKAVTEQRHNPKRDCTLQAIVDLPDERKLLKASKSMQTQVLGLEPERRLELQDFLTLYCKVSSDIIAELKATLIITQTDPALLYTVYSAKIASSKDEQVAIDEVVKTVGLATANKITFSASLMIAHGVKALYKHR